MWATNIYPRNGTQRYYPFPLSYISELHRKWNAIAPTSWLFYFWPIWLLQHEEDSMEAVTWKSKFSSLSCLATIKFCMIFYSASLIFWTPRLNHLIEEQQILEAAVDVWGLTTEGKKKINKFTQPNNWIETINGHLYWYYVVSPLTASQLLGEADCSEVYSDNSINRIFKCYCRKQHWKYLLENKDALPSEQDTVCSRKCTGTDSHYNQQ